MSEIYNNKDLHCLHCKVEFPKRMTMANGRGGQLHKGMIMVCSNCTGVQILGDTTWRPFEKSDFDALPPQSKRALLVTVRGLVQRLDAGKEWSPYETRPQN